MDLSRRDNFAFWSRENLRFSDTDLIGHVNNVAFAALLESGRTMYTRGLDFPAFPPGLLLVMARIEIDYRQELHWPGVVDIGTRAVRVGTASFVLGQGIFRGDDCITTGRSTLVMMDKATRRSSPMPVDYRQALMEEIISPRAPATPVR